MTPANAPDTESEQRVGRARVLQAHEGRAATWVGLAVSVGALVLYLATLSRNYLGDGIEFAMTVEDGGAANFLKPNHMLYPLIPGLVYRLLAAWGMVSHALVPLQVASALGGAVAVGLLYVLARRITRSTAISAVAAVGFALSFGLWRYSTDAESVTIPLVFALVVLLTLLPHDRTAPPTPVLTGVLTALATVVYQSQAVVTIVVVVAYLADTQWTLAARIRSCAVFVATAGALTAAVYAVAAVWVFDVRSIGQLLDWQFALSASGRWGNPTSHSLFEAAQSMAIALGGPVTTPGNTTASAAATIAVVGFAALFLAPFVVSFVVRRHLRQHRRTLAILATWAILFGGFALYWVAGDVSFFSPVLVPWWLFTALVVKSVGSAPPRAGRAAVAVTGLAVLAVAAHGFVVEIAKTRLYPSTYEIARSVGERTSPADLVVTTGGDGLFLTIPYFGQRTTFSTFHHLLNVDQPPSPWLIAPATGNYGKGRPAKGAVFARLDALIDQACARGGRTYLVGVGAPSDPEWTELALAGLHPNDFARFHTRFAWRVAGEDVLEIVGRCDRR